MKDKYREFIKTFVFSENYYCVVSKLENYFPVRLIESRDCNTSEGNCRKFELFALTDVVEYCLWVFIAPHSSNFGQKQLTFYRI